MAAENAKLVWVVEADCGARFVYEEILSLRYKVSFFEDTASFQQGVIECLQRGRPVPDLVIADLRLPDQNFLLYLQHRTDSDVFHPPFLIVSSVDDLDILRHCFEKGAMDYLTKPFGKGELIVKLERLFQGQTEKKVEPVMAKPACSLLEIDPISHTISVKNREAVRLTAREFQMVALLNGFPAHSISRSEIMRRVWGDVRVEPKTLDVHFSALRKKLCLLNIELRFIPPDLYQLTLP